MTDYLAYWHDHIIQQQTHNQQLRQQVLDDLKLFVSLLVDPFGAKRIILFGSLVKGTFTKEITPGALRELATDIEIEFFPVGFFVTSKNPKTT